MSLAILDDAARSRLRTELEAIPGVRRALIEPSPSQVFVVCDPSEATPTELIVRATLARNGLAAHDVDVQICHVPTPQPRRRVRFLSAYVESPRAGRSRAAVELEWGGVTFRDHVEGETGPAVELRLAAMATLRTLEAVLHGALRFQLVGIKSFRAFDAEVVVVMLRSEQGSVQTLVGASLATDSPYRSAALAVLNATNRYLGNYLANLDT
jgi:hypothetical protein